MNTKFNILVLKLLCSILDLLLFPNVRDNETMKKHQFLWSIALRYIEELEMNEPS